MNHTHTDTDLPIENEYPKLVRDNIPTMITSQGRTAQTHIADDKEYIQFLLSKLIEEATELKNADSLDHQKEEIADVREVLESLLKTLGISEEEISQVQTSKALERGGFGGKIILDVKPQ